jgi:hypothetical protein
VFSGPDFDLVFPYPIFPIQNGLSRSLFRFSVPLLVTVLPQQVNMGKAVALPTAFWLL